MGLVGDFFATTVFKMKVDSADAIKDIKNMSKEQQKAAKDAAAALNDQAKAAETMGMKYAKGAALIVGAYLVAKNGMEALRKEGIDILTSCEQGVCGTCLTRVLEGEVDHRDMYLTDEEKAANEQFMPCCSRARSKLLVLDL